MLGIRDTPGLELQVVATGMHLSPQFGLTYREIEADGFTIDARVDIELTSDTPAGIARSMGLGLIGFGKLLNAARPDLMVVLGDRFEILSAVAAALVSRVPVAHLHGGEVSEGAFDESIRHSITKMSHLHFVAAEEYRRRVVQLGEDPEHVFLVGGLGVDNAKHVKRLSRSDLEKSLDFTFGGRNLLVTFHPVTLERAASAQQMEELLAALGTLDDTTLIFTKPNADPGSRILIEMIDQFVGSHPNARSFASLGQQRYFSMIEYVDGVVGNSSSGLCEVPSFHKGTVNIGDRQRGRLKAESVIDCAPDRLAIGVALTKLYSAAFQESLATVRNPYGDGGSSEAIVRILRDQPLTNLLKKKFFDLQS